MMDGFTIPFTAILTAFLALEMILYIGRSRKRKSAEEFLRQAKRESFEMAQISLGNPYPLIQISENGHIIFINPAAYAQFTRIREMGLQHPVLAGLEDIIKRGESDAREIDLGDVSYNQIISPTRVNNKIVYTIYCYNVTERKAYEKKLHESREEAESARRQAEYANRARGDFLANMSHELRTPMNGIIGLTDILVEAGVEVAEHQELIEAVNSSAHNLMILLNDILDFSKIEAGELTLESIPFDLRKLVRQIEALQKPVASRKGLIMRCDIADNVPNSIVGDPSRLQQIINNLVNNALKFTEHGGVTLTINGEEDGKGYFITHIVVADTGIGIAENQKDKIFKKFQQADISISRKYGGTGLGLAICKDLAEMMGGSISLQSEEGRGSTFTVVIPAKISNTTALAGNELKAVQAMLHINKTGKILVVDDHPVNLLFMRQILSRMGLENLYEASSGAQAIELFQSNTYDLILMDCQMPDMDGHEAARQMRQMESGAHRTIIIAVTANVMKGTEEKCRAAGMDGYISKPVDKEKLQAILQHWIPGHDIYEEKGSTSEGEGKISNIFDWNHLHQYTNGNKETEHLIINMFLESLDQDLKDIQRKFQAQNFVEWEAIAHKIHGAAEHMGAFALAEICGRAENLSAEDAVSIKDLHLRILVEARHLLAMLQKNGLAA